MNMGLAVFITEWGTCSSTGNGTVDLQSANEWMVWAKKHMIGNTNWGVYDKNESCASIITGRSDKGGWTIDDLTKSGRWMRSYLRNAIEGGDDQEETPSKDGDDDQEETPTKDDDQEETPTKDDDQEETPTKDDENSKTYDCCSWDGGISCGKHSDWCSIAKRNCTSACNGTWISAPGSESIEELERKKAREENCCSWDGGKTCPKHENDWCNATKTNCQVNCCGMWAPKENLTN